MKRPINFEIKEKQGDTTDKLIKKFLKKTSRSKIIQFYLESLQTLTRSQRKRHLKSRRKYIKQQIQKEHEQEMEEQIRINENYPNLETEFLKS